MDFHVTSFFVFWVKCLSACPPITHLSVLHDRGAVGTDWRACWHRNFCVAGPVSTHSPSSSGELQGDQRNHDVADSFCHGHNGDK